MLSARFLAALATANVADLASLFAEDVTWVSDGGPHRTAARKPIHGRDRVSRGLAGIVSRFSDETSRVSLESLNGRHGLILWHNGGISTVIQWHEAHGQIIDVWFSRNPAKLAHLGHHLGVPSATA